MPGTEKILGSNPGQTCFFKVKILKKIVDLSLLSLLSACVYCSLKLSSFPLLNRRHTPLSNSKITASTSCLESGIEFL